MKYVSVTGLKPKSVFHYINFWMLAIPSFNQAKNAKGNQFCEVKKMHGFQCTLTVWSSREDMLHFLHSGKHLKAMQAFHRMATGRTYGYASDTIPKWDEAFELLLNKGKEY